MPCQELCVPKCVPNYSGECVLTDKALKGLKPRKVLYEVPDSQGLSVRVNPAGRICFQYRYRANGKDARVKLGTYPGTSLAEARAAHQSARTMLDQGIDPAFQKKTDRLALSTAETVRHLADEISTRFVAVHRKRPKDAAHILNAAFVPNLRRVRVRDVTR